MEKQLLLKLLGYALEDADDYQKYQKEYNYWFDNFKSYEGDAIKDLKELIEKIEVKLKFDNDWEIYAEKIRSRSLHWQNEYNISRGIIFDKEKEIEKMKIEINELKLNIKNSQGSD